jgi:glycosyltransferase involved in cell wall biosynthesis
VNDASTDDSKIVIGELMISTNNRSVHYLELEHNSGAGNARNIGLNKAGGEYILFLDSDDWINSNYISCMIAALISNNADIAMCSILDEYENFQSSTIRYFYNNTISISGDYALKLLSHSVRNDIYITPMVGNKIYRKRFLFENDLLFLDNNCCEDDVFAFLSFIRKPNLVLVKETQQHYRQRENSITHCFSKKRIDDLIEAFSLLRKRLIENNLYDKYRIEYCAFFEKCISTTYQALINASLTMQEKKNHLYYLLERLISEFSLQSIVDYLDLVRIHRFLGIDY